MERLCFVKKENKKTDIANKSSAKSVFFYFSKSNGITLVALVITIIVILILAGISLNSAIGDNGIISRAQTTKLKEEEAEVENEILTGIASLDTEYYQKRTTDSGISVNDIYNISSLQKYVNGKINGFNYNENGEATVYYTNSNGSYTVKVKDGTSVTYSGIYITKDDTDVKLSMSTENGNNTIQLTTDIEDVTWEIKEGQAEIDSKTGIVTKTGKGEVIIEGHNTNGDSVSVRICDEEDYNDTSFDFDKTVSGTADFTIDIGNPVKTKVQASLVNNNGEYILKISGTGNIQTSAITFNTDEDSTRDSKVKSIVIEEGVTNIPANTFSNFTSAESITIGKSVAEIDSNYLYHLSSIKTVNMNAKNVTMTSVKEYSNRKRCRKNYTMYVCRIFKCRKYKNIK
jgi:hypothetical protein